MTVVDRHATPAPTFGDVNRDVLDELGTRPSVTYLKKVTRGHGHEQKPSKGHA